MAVDTTGGSPVTTRTEYPETNVTNIYEAAQIHPIAFWDGSHFLAALMWLSFVTVLFLLVLRVTEPDTVSGGAAAVFFVLAVTSSFAARGGKDDN